MLFAPLLACMGSFDTMSGWLKATNILIEFDDKVLAKQVTPVPRPKSTRNSAILLGAYSRGRLSPRPPARNTPKGNPLSPGPQKRMDRRSTSDMSPTRRHHRKSSFGQRGWSHADFKMPSSLNDELPKI